MSSFAFDAHGEGQDEPAFTRIYEGHGRMVRRLAAAALGDCHGAEDVAQEVFLGVWRKLPARLRDREPPLEAWLATTTRREVARAIRKRFKLATPELLYAFEQRGVVDERIKRVHGWPSDPWMSEALDRLPERQRQALVLRFTLDLTRAETARVMATTPKAVKELHSQAFKKLNQMRDGHRPCEVRGSRDWMRVRIKRLPVLRARKWALAAPALSRRSLPLFASRRQRGRSPGDC
jgi:RNA polymerase sigma-70 factor (ECF subfamily)